MTNRVPLSRSASDFVRALVRSARTDGPPAGAKMRALSRISALGTAAAAARGLAHGSSVALCVGSASVAAALGGLAGWSMRDARSPQVSTTVAPSECPPSGGPAGLPTAEAPAAPAPPSTAPAVARPTQPSACAAVALADGPPTECSQDGNPEALELVNTCREAVDIYWVDYKCREVFAGRAAPGEAWDQHTFDTHPFRVRDHATHRLIKEWVGPPQNVTDGDASVGPALRADILIRDESTAEDTVPSECSRIGRPVKLRFVNGRTHGVAVIFWVGFDCREQLTMRLEPGEQWTASTSERHPWRVRDENGNLLVDFPNEERDAADSTVYVALP